VRCPDLEAQEEENSRMTGWTRKMPVAQHATRKTTELVRMQALTLSLPDPPGQRVPKRDPFH